MGLASNEGLGITRPQLNLAFNLDRDVEGQFRKAYRAARVSPLLLTEHADNEVSKAVYDRRLTCETWGRVHHSEYPSPARNAGERTKFPLQASEDRQSREASGNVGLLLIDLKANLAQRLGQASISVCGTVSRDDCSGADYAHPRKRQRDAWWQLERRWMNKAS